ncbi:MAG: cysteine desulfurase family protein [Patescibacteria group bacterium]
MRDILYLDYAAATPVDPRVRETVEPFFHERFGNPSSLHAMGEEASHAVQQAREIVAQFLQCRPDEILFTSGATESNNLAILGYARANQDKGKHIITTAIEHHSVLYAARALIDEGFDVTELPVSSEGLVDPAQLTDALRNDTILVSIGYANNEIGTIQPIREIHHALAKRKIFFHTDAVQAAGALTLDTGKLGVDALSLTSSKMYGPKGVGVLYVKKGTVLLPLMYGGGQQRGMRSGTEHVAGIVGFARALEISQQEKEHESQRLTSMRDRIIIELQRTFANMKVNGSREHRLPNNINVVLPGLDGEALVIYASQAGLMFSTGSACSTVEQDPSHVLRAIGRSEEEANSSIRITLGRTTKEQDIPRIIATLKDIAATLNVKR